MSSMPYRTLCLSFFLVQVSLLAPPFSSQVLGQANNVMAPGTSTSAKSSATAFDANAPEKSGYSLVFSDDFSDPSKIDIRNTGQPGYNWYMNNFYWSNPTPPDAISFGDDGITLSGLISTATGTGRDKTALVGRGWSGGAYFEAQLQFDPDKVFVEDRHWPAFYGLSWQLASKTDQTPNQPNGYQHFAEIDFMEYGFWNHRNTTETSKHFWLRGGTKYTYFWQIMHDWYGIKGVTCADTSWCGISNNAGSALMKIRDLRGWHRYGARWVVGDATRKSFIQAYYDGAPIGPPVYWTAYDKLENVPVPPTDENPYSITDFTKFIIVFQANEKAPVKVRQVKVWQ